jgi:hypothetical protein
MQEREPASGPGAHSRGRRLNLNPRELPRPTGRMTARALLIAAIAGLLSLFVLLPGALAWPSNLPGGIIAERVAAIGSAYRYEKGLSWKDV